MNWPKRHTPRSLYFMKPVGLEGPIKIGCSSLPDTRLEFYAGYSPIPLEIVGIVAGTIDDERFLHSRFAHLRSHREWFHSTPELREAVAGLIALGSVAEWRKPYLVSDNAGQPA